jgi:hypothetical protein
VLFRKGIRESSARSTCRPEHPESGRPGGWIALLCVGIVVNNEDFNLAGVQSELSQYNSTRPRAAGMSVKGRMAVLFPQK